MKPIVYHPSPAVYAKLARPQDSHKGLFGSIAIVGSNVGMVGAAMLAGRAALATGAGKVWLHVLDERLVVDLLAPELMVRGALDDLSAANAIAVGMGLGQDDAAQAVLRHALTYVDTPMVIDADALNLIAQHTELQTQLKGFEHTAIITSFDLKIHQALQQQRSHFKRGLLIEEGFAEANLAEKAIEQALELQCCQIGWMNQLATNDIVKATQNAGLAVSIWTVNDIERAKYLRDLGIQGLITDFPKMMQTALEQIQ